LASEHPAAEPTAAARVPYLWPCDIAKLPAEQQPAQWERTARSLRNRAKELARSRAKWKRKAEASEEALNAIIEIAKNAKIIQ
jgi:hypothetical protein